MPSGAAGVNIALGEAGLFRICLLFYRSRWLPLLRGTVDWFPSANPAMHQRYASNRFESSLSKEPSLTKEPHMNT